MLNRFILDNYDFGSPWGLAFFYDVFTAEFLNLFCNEVSVFLTVVSTLGCNGLYIVLHIIKE